MTWRTVNLGEFLKVRQDRFKPKDKAIEGLKRVNKIDFSGNIYLSNKDSNTDMILVKQGDLLISGINVEKGAVAVYSGQEDVTATIHYSSYEFDNEKIDVDFLKLFLKSPEFLDAIKEQVPGGIKTEIKPKHLLPLEVTIPELDEQKEVVEKFSSFHSKQNSISTELNHQLALVKELRQAYLREAMQGKLVPQDSTDEPAEILLEKIKAEKEKLVAEKRIKRDKPLPPISAEEIPFEIPSNWTWCRLGKIFNEIKYGTSKSCDYNTERSSAVLRIPNVSSGIIDGTDLKYTDFTDDEIKDLSLEENDILIIRSNGSKSLVGETALVTNEFVGFAFAGYLIRLRFSKELINAHYLMSATNSEYFRDLIEIPLRTTVGINNINTTEISNLIIPLPPLAEQERIVAKLEKLMTFCDKLEANIRQGITNADQLLQTALKEALEPKQAFELTS